MAVSPYQDGRRHGDTGQHHTWPGDTRFGGVREARDDLRAHLVQAAELAAIDHQRRDETTEDHR